MTNNKEIEEGNKLIAEFMKNAAVNSPHKKPNKELKYHESWDWLMPVVEKIRQTTEHGHLITISFYSKGIGNPTECRIYLNDLGAEEITTECLNPIEAVWLAVIDFIKWYNNQKLPQ